MRNYTPVVKGHIYYGGPIPRCQCGEKPPEGTNQNDARVWHREHKQEVNQS